MKLHWRLRSVALCVAVALLMGAGCKHNKGGEVETNMTPPETTTGTGEPAIDLDSLLFGPSGLQAVYFDYDSSSLRPDAMATLKENVEKVKQAPGIIIQIAGHCDERGTQEYNLALGERRALAVRAYLIQLGVSGDRLVTISYGEEYPAVVGHDEAAWAKNRRCEFQKAKAN